MSTTFHGLVLMEFLSGYDLVDRFWKFTGLLQVDVPADDDLHWCLLPACWHVAR